MSDTIREDFKLPSLGKIYSQQFNPNVTLRSMTVEDEMKRLSPSKKPYKAMSEIIESCMVEKLPISVYDLCMGDYIYLLYKLRIVTYGSEYNMQYVCPSCGSLEKVKVNLDKLKINKFTEKLKDSLNVELPVSKKIIKLRMQTPRDFDDIAEKTEEMKEEFPEMTGDPSYLLTLQSFIAGIDGNPVDQIMIKEFLKKLPMADANKLIQSATKVNNMIGVEGSIKVTCENCGLSTTLPFRFTDEFFRPTIN